MSYASLQLCSGRAAYEAIPTPRLRLDLARLRERLEAAGAEVTDARVMLIAKWERELTIARDGRILIKSADPAEARRLFERVLELVGGTSTS